MDAKESRVKGRGGASKKKVKEQIAKAENSKAAALRFMGRPGCHPCDRSEAGHQLELQNKKISALNVTLSILEYEYR